MNHLQSVQWSVDFERFYCNYLAINLSSELHCSCFLSNALKDMMLSCTSLCLTPPLNCHPYLCHIYLIDLADCEAVASSKAEWLECVTFSDDRLLI